MEASEISRRGEWLSSLTEAQIRALASQRKLEDWRTAPVVALIGRLLQFDDIDVPRRG
jgi:hypothetical protein